MYVVVAHAHSPLGQQHGGGALALEHAVHQHAILAVARQVELRVVVEQFQMSARYETRVAHVNVHLASTRVPADHDTFLPDEVLEVAAVEPRDRGGGRLLGPLHLGGRWGRRLQREQRPRVALRASRKLSLGHGRRARTDITNAVHTRGADALHEGTSQYRRENRRRRVATRISGTCRTRAFTI